MINDSMIDEGTRKILDDLDYETLELGGGFVALKEPYKQKRIQVMLKVSCSGEAYSGFAFVDQQGYGRFESSERFGELEPLVRELNGVAMEMYHFFAC